jgi:hypothetical protein
MLSSEGKLDLSDAKFEGLFEIYVERGNLKLLQNWYRMKDNKMNEWISKTKTRREKNRNFGGLDLS